MAKVNIPGRKAPEHNVLHLPETMGASVGSAWDDELSINTQSSSQWDSLCHFQHQKSRLAYNGAKPAKVFFRAASTAANRMPTLDHWHERGGMVARGVLVDYKAYAEERGIAFGAFDGTRITVADIEACAAHQGVEFRPGDVLVVRTGATLHVDSNTAEDVATAMGGMKISGVHGCEETARWLWNKRFAAVTGDSNSFEAFPPLKPDGSEGGMSDLGKQHLSLSLSLYSQDDELTWSIVLHSYLLSLFGMPIGEIWDLQRLSEHCKKTKRYSFMLTSIPLNHPCLIASPPNAIAIF